MARRQTYPSFVDRLRLCFNRYWNELGGHGRELGDVARGNKLAWPFPHTHEG
jgi:hypothetical protein